MYTPTLVEVPVAIDMEEYRQKDVPILSQGNEGACTGSAWRRWRTTRCARAG